MKQLLRRALDESEFLSAVSDPPACTGLQRHAISTLNTPTTPFGSVLADIPWVPRKRASYLYICTVPISRQRHEATRTISTGVAAAPPGPVQLPPTLS